MTGLFRNYGIRNTPNGMLLRCYNSKRRQNQWGDWVLVPELPPELAQICPVATITAILERSNNWTIDPDEVLEPDKPGSTTKVQAVPLFVKCPNKKKPKKSAGLVSATIQNKVQNLFMNNTKHLGEKLSDYFKPHSFRHAVASYLSVIGVNLESIAAHVGVGPETLKSSYILAVDGDWPRPKACLAAFSQMAVKILVPFVHYQVKVVDGEYCACLRVLRAFMST